MGIRQRSIDGAGGQTPRLGQAPGRRAGAVPVLVSEKQSRFSDENPDQLVNLSRPIGLHKPTLRELLRRIEPILLCGRAVQGERIVRLIQQMLAENSPPNLRTEDLQQQ